MRKKLLGAALAACFSGAMVMGAFAGEMTVEQVLEKYAAATTEMSSFGAAVDGVANISLGVPDANMTMDMNGSTTMDMQMTIDPLAMEMSAQMSGEAMGQGGTMSMQMYMVPSENNTIKVYTGADAGEGMEWSVTEVENEAVSQIKDMLANGEMITDLPIAFELKDGTVEVGGKQCYALVSSLTWEDAMNLYAYAIEATGGMIPVESILDEETMETMTYLLGGLVINFEIDVDTETFLPMRAHIDTEGSDWVSLGATVAAMMGLTDEEGNLMSVDLNVNDLHLDYTYNYDQEVSIEVPQEIVDVATDLGNAMDLTDSAAGMLGGDLTEEVAELSSEQ